jgi:hypothetical protein
MSNSDTFRSKFPRTLWDMTFSCQFIEFSLTLRTFFSVISLFHTNKSIVALPASSGDTHGSSKLLALLSPFGVRLATLGSWLLSSLGLLLLKGCLMLSWGFVL